MMMTGTLDPTNLSALQYNQINADIVTELCNPLFTNFGITVFMYSHFFDNGTYLDLCTHKSWQEHNIEYFAAHPFITDYIKNIYQTNTKYSLWDNDVTSYNDKIMRDFITNSCGFDIWHGFSIYEHHKASLEAWHFATTKDNFKIVNFYFNRLNLLHQFIRYFQDKASSLIDATDLSKLVVLKKQDSLTNLENTLPLNDKMDEYTSQLNVKRYQFHTSHGVVYLSAREIECIIHLSNSKTNKEIARLMSLSPRTVESYIDNAKRKLACVTRSQLAEVVLQHHGYLSVKINKEKRI